MSFGEDEDLPSSISGPSPKLRRVEGTVDVSMLPSFEVDPAFGGATNPHRQKLEVTALLDSVRLELETKINDLIRKHGLYEYAVKLMGTLGGGYRQVNPMTLFDVSEARGMVEAIITNFKLVVETRENILGGHAQSETEKQNRLRRYEQQKARYTARINQFNTYIAAIGKFIDEPRGMSIDDTTIIGHRNWVETATLRQSGIYNLQRYEEQVRSVEQTLRKSLKQRDGSTEPLAKAVANTMVQQLSGTSRAFANNWKTEMERLGSIKPQSFDPFRDVAIQTAKGSARNIPRDSDIYSDFDTAYYLTYLWLCHLVNTNDSASSSAPVEITFHVGNLCHLALACVPAGQNPSEIYQRYLNILNRGIHLFPRGRFGETVTDIESAGAGTPPDVRSLTIIDVSGEMIDGELNLTSPIIDYAQVASRILFSVLDLRQQLPPLFNLAALSTTLKAYIRVLTNIANAQVEPSLYQEASTIWKRRSQWSQLHLTAHLYRDLANWKPEFFQPPVPMTADSATLITEIMSESARQLSLWKPNDNLDQFLDFLGLDDPGNKVVQYTEIIPIHLDDPSRLKLEDSNLTIAAAMDTVLQAPEQHGDASVIGSIEKLNIPENLYQVGVSMNDPLGKVMILYSRLREWTRQTRDSYQRAQTESVRNLNFVEQEARRQGIVAGGGDVIMEDSNEMEAIIQNEIDEKTQHIDEEITKLRTAIESGKGINLRPDLDIQSQNAFAEVQLHDESWARYFSSWQRLATTRNAQAQSFFINIVASLINESQIISGARGNYIQQNMRTANVSNRAHFILALVSIPPQRI